MYRFASLDCFHGGDSLAMPTVHLLDYVAGNIRSLVNAINQVGYEVAWIRTPEDVKNADVRHPEILFADMVFVSRC